MPTYQVAQKLEAPNLESRKEVNLLLEPNFPDNAGIRWNKNFGPQPAHFRGPYTYTSSPRALQSNKKAPKDKLNLQR